MAEAGAQLAAGQTAKNHLEATSFLTRHLGALADRHGVSGAEEVLQYAEPWIRKELELKRFYFADSDEDGPLTPIVREAVKLLSLSDELFEVWRKGGDQALAERQKELCPSPSPEQPACLTPEVTTK